MRWERATPVALFLPITHLMSATGVARSRRMRLFARQSPALRCRNQGQVTQDLVLRVGACGQPGLQRKQGLAELRLAP